jgi:hypothetical protein
VEGSGTNVTLSGLTITNGSSHRKHYERAVEWMKKNEATFSRDKHQAEELRRFRSEAEEVLELKK